MKKISKVFLILYIGIFSCRVIYSSTNKEESKSGYFGLTIGGGVGKDSAKIIQNTFDPIFKTLNELKEKTTGHYTDEDWKSIGDKFLKADIGKAAADIASDAKSTSHKMSSTLDAIRWAAYGIIVSSGIFVLYMVIRLARSIKDTKYMKKLLHKLTHRSVEGKKTSPRGFLPRFGAKNKRKNYL